MILLICFFLNHDQKMYLLLDRRPAGDIWEGF